MKFGDGPLNVFYSNTVNELPVMQIEDIPPNTIALCQPPQYDVRFVDGEMVLICRPGKVLSMIKNVGIQQ